MIKTLFSAGRREIREVDVSRVGTTGNWPSRIRKPSGKVTPRYLEKQIYRCLFKDYPKRKGHVHFYFQGYREHVIMFCGRSSPGLLLVKTPECGRGEAVRWEDSTFAPIAPGHLFSELGSRINRVWVDNGGLNMSWTCLGDFLSWLEERSDR